MKLDQLRSSVRRYSQTLIHYMVTYCNDRNQVTCFTVLFAINVEAVEVTNVHFSSVYIIKVQKFGQKVGRVTYDKLFQAIEGLLHRVGSKNLAL